MNAFLALSVLVAVVSSQSGKFTPDGCWEVIPNCSMGYCIPFQIQQAFSMDNCMNKCLDDPKCTGFQFLSRPSPGQGNCRHYNVMPGTKYPYVPQFRPFGGNNNNFGGGLRPGFMFDEAKGKGEWEFPEETEPIKGAPLDEEDIRRVAEIAKKEGNATLDSELASIYGGRRDPFFYKADGTMIYRWTGSCIRPSQTTAAPATLRTAATPAPAAPLVAPKSTGGKVRCPRGEIPKYLKVENSELKGNDDKTFTAEDAKECMTACTKNKLPDGTATSCLSVDFDRDSKKCAISASAIGPVGDGARKESDGKDYYQKVCLETDTARKCEDVFNQLPGTVLSGFVRGTTTEDNFEGCVKACLSAEALFGFQCISGQFYGSEKETNCVLNEENKDSDPSNLNLVDDTVVYFDFQCKSDRLNEPIKMGEKGNMIQVGKSTWGPWSYCNKKAKTAIRYKNCKSLNPASCESETKKCNA